MAFKNQAEIIDRNQHARHEARMDHAKIYRAMRDGDRRSVLVYIGLNWRELDPRLDLVRHSPDGFNWSYGGSGPSQLALAICADALGDDAQAMRVYQQFKNAFVALQQGDEWEISAAEVRAMVQRFSHVG